MISSHFKYMNIVDQNDLNILKKYLEKKGIFYHKNLSNKTKETHYFLDNSAIVLEEMQEHSKIKICSGCCFNSMNTQRNLEKVIERKLKV